jgi:hypothetical protein
MGQAVACPAGARRTGLGAGAPSTKIKKPKIEVSTDLGDCHTTCGDSFTNTTNGPPPGAKHKRFPQQPARCGQTRNLSQVGQRPRLLPLRGR